MMAKLGERIKVSVSHMGEQSRCLVYSWMYRSKAYEKSGLKLESHVLIGGS